jgi:hypothetical protein
MLRCFNCGAEASHDHHVVPRSLGGVETVPLCHNCHGKAHGRTGGFRSTRELTIAAIQQRQARGRVTGSVPFGYSARDGVLIPNEDELAIVARAKDLRANGASMREIVEVLARDGFRGRSGKPLELTQVARVLRWKARPTTVAGEVVERKRRGNPRQRSLFDAMGGSR